MGLLFVESSTLNSTEGRNLGSVGANKNLACRETRLINDSTYGVVYGFATKTSLLLFSGDVVKHKAVKFLVSFNFLKCNHSKNSFDCLSNVCKNSSTP